MGISEKWSPKNGALEKISEYKILGKMIPWSLFFILVSMTEVPQVTKMAWRNGLKKKKQEIQSRKIKKKKILFDFAWLNFLFFF